MGRFMVSYTYQGRGSEVVEAETLEDAERLVEEKVNRDDFEPEDDELEIEHFDVAELHPVTRGGKEIWTTYIQSGDKRGHPSALFSTPLFASGVGS